jgi:hypothetical protein
MDIYGLAGIGLQEKCESAEVNYWSHYSKNGAVEEIPCKGLETSSDPQKPEVTGL